MNRASATATVALALSAPFVTPAATPTAAPASAGWTAQSRHLEVIHAHGKLMENMELLMQPIDATTVQKTALSNALYLHTYEMPKASASDSDFEAALDNKKK